MRERPKTPRAGGTIRPPGSTESCDLQERWRRRESNPRPRPHRPSVYERSPRFRFARRPVRGRPADGLAILSGRASGDWLSLGAEPDRWRPCPGLGPNREGRRYLGFN